MAVSKKLGEKNMLHLIIYICTKYENYFLFDGIESKDTSNVMVQKYMRLREIYEECLQKKLSDEEANSLYGEEVEELRYAIKRKEFVCKVSKVAFLDGMKMIAQFWGDYYTEIDFEEVLQIPEVHEQYPELINLRKPEVFHAVYPEQYHVFFGKHPDLVDVSSDFMWHFGKRIRQEIDVDNYDWIRGW